MAKRASNPYPCLKALESGRIAYEFITDQKVRYRAYFSDYGYMFGSDTLDCQFYSFDLVVLGGVRPPKFTAVDLRIADTVRDCFEAIFQFLENVVIAVYDSSDKSELARRRKFDGWFKDADFDQIEKIDFDVEGEDYNLLSSVFIYRSLPNREAVLERYQLIMEGGNIPLD